MWYCGIDIASKNSFVVVSDEKGEVVLSKEIETSVSSFRMLLNPYVCEKLKIAIEAGAEMLWIHDCLKELGAEVVVVNPRNLKLIVESRRKTDKIDAKILCDLLRINGLPCPVHVPSMPARVLRGLLKARRQAIRCRTSMCNAVRGILRQEGVKLEKRKIATQKCWKELCEKKYNHAHIPIIVESYFKSFMALTRTIQELDKELQAHAEKDARIEVLKTMPFVGPVAALTLVAAIDQVGRFQSSRALISYSGLAPSVRQSGERANYGPINRIGRSEIRGVWVQIAHLVGHSDKTEAKPLRRWFLRVSRRRGKKTALVALARKLLAIAFFMLRTGSVYDVKMLAPKKKAA